MRRGASRAAPIGVCALLISLAATAGVSSAHDTTGISTLEQTIDGENPEQGFSFLELEGGDRRIVREQLAAAQGGRAERRRSLIYLGQITDFQLSDEESPARVEFLDRNPASSDFKSAHRPQESLVPHQVEFTIRQMNRFVRSPVEQGSGRHARMTNAVMTGDLADNQHRNETELVVGLLEGGRIDSGSGSTDPDDYTGRLGCPPGGPAQQALIDEAPNYTGVQDYDDYPGGIGDEDFYDPDEPAGEYEAKDFPTYTGLLDEAQEPFQARGLRVPSYVLFGNHDALAQGNEDANLAFDQIAQGCVKPFLAPVGSLPGPGDGSVLDELLDPDVVEATGVAVPPDPERAYVDKTEFKELHATGEQPDEHGFALVDSDELEASWGSASYYSFAPDTGSRAVRYIVLDTVSEGGVVGESSRGNIDDPQWRWLRDELAQAERRNEIVVLFSHHATGSIDANVADELFTQDPSAIPGAPPCDDPDDPNPGCDRDPRISTPLHFGDDLERLLLRNPNVVALVAGHSHENAIEPFERDNGRGGFWEVKSPAIIDWPPQHRVIEVMDNRDGTLSIFGTILDHDGPTRAPDEDTPVDEMTVAELASVGRTVSYNDPQVGPGPQEGRRSDRNVELLIGDPREADREQPGGSGGGGGGGTTGGGSGDGETPGGGGASGATDAASEDPVAVSVGGAVGSGEAADDLPFTGLGLALLALVAAALLSAGAALRRRARS